MIQQLETEIHELDKEYAKVAKEDLHDALPIDKKRQEKREEVDKIWAKYRPVTGQPDSTSCGPTSAQMAIQAVTGTNVSVDQLGKEAHTNEEGKGTLIDPLASAIKLHGVNAEVKPIRSSADLNATPTTPAVVWAVTGMNETHIVVVDWVWKAKDGTTLVHYRDPLDGGMSGTMTAAEFDKTLRRNLEGNGGAIVLTGPSSTNPPKVAEQPKTDTTPKTEPGIKDKTGAYVPSQQLQNYAFTLQGSGLGEVAVCCTNPGDQPVTICLEPGIACVPSDPAFQQMLLVGNLELVLPPRGGGWSGGRLLAVIATDAVSDAGGARPAVAAVCTQFYKKVPNSAVTFTPGPCSDPNLVRLARFFAKEPLRGPWDQGATWIVTDHLTREQMNTRLVPGLSPWTYLRSLRIAGQEGGANFQDPNWRPCLDPDLLLDPKDTDRDLSWFVETLSGTDPEALRAWLEAHWAELSSPAAELKVSEHRCDLGDSLCRLENDGLRRLGARLLLEGIVSEQRAAVSPHLHPESLRGALLGQCPEAVEVVSAYRLRGLLPQLRELAAKATTPDLRSRAQAVIDQFK